MSFGFSTFTLTTHMSLNKNFYFWWLGYWPYADGTYLEDWVRDTKDAG